MARFPGILDRFRHLLVPPGRPAEALGVPAAGDDVEAELGPLLGELDAVGAEAARIEGEARLEEERRRARGIREAAAILEEAPTPSAPGLRRAGGTKPGRRLGPPGPRRATRRSGSARASRTASRS